MSEIILSDPQGVVWWWDGFITPESFEAFAPPTRG